MPGVESETDLKDSDIGEFFVSGLCSALANWFTRERSRRNAFEMWALAVCPSWYSS